MTPKSLRCAARRFLPEKKKGRISSLPPANNKNLVGTSGLRFPWWLHFATLPIGQASCFGFSNRGSDTHLLPDWPGCALVPWQQGQRDQSLQNDLSHHLPGVELRARCKGEQVAPTSAHSQVENPPPWLLRVLGGCCASPHLIYLIFCSIFLALPLSQGSCPCRRKTKILAVPEVDLFAQPCKLQASI